VKSLGKFPDPFYGEIFGQPDALRRAAAGLAEQAETLERLPTPAPGAEVILTGMGGSYATCYPLAVQLATRGLPALMLGTAELLHFRLGLLDRVRPVVVVSQSGESAEIVSLVERVHDLAARPSVVAVTNGSANTLARAADRALDTRAGSEVGPSTGTFAGALVVLAGIGRRWIDGSPRVVADRVMADAEQAAVAIERLLAHRGLGDELFETFGSLDRFVILGRGPARAAAEMAALTVKEAAGLPVEAYDAAQFRHGPLELAGPRLAAIVLATEPETEALDRRLARELRESGSSVLEITTAPVDAVFAPRRTHVGIGAVDRLLAPAAAIVPIQLLAHRLALAHGRRPGTFVRASKVTTRE
jgi:glucosamine--fructose-6-phosphate aminotransferase (isomerizing)